MNASDTNDNAPNVLLQWIEEIDEMGDAKALEIEFEAIENALTTHDGYCRECHYTVLLCTAGHRPDTRRSCRSRVARAALTSLRKRFEKARKS